MPELYGLSDPFQLHYVEPTFSDVTIDKNAVFRHYMGVNPVETVPVLISQKTATISWVSSIPGSNTKLYILWDDGSFPPLSVPLTNVIDNGDSHTLVWNLPGMSIILNQKLRLMVEEIGSDPLNYMVSDPFTILPPIWLIAPNGSDDFNYWGWLPFGQYEYTESYDEVNIWFGSSLQENEYPRFRLEYCADPDNNWSTVPDNSANWQTIPGADSITMPFAYYEGDTLICAEANFVWNISGLDISECWIRVVNLLPNDTVRYRDTADTPILIDTTPPEVLGSYVWNTNGDMVEADGELSADVNTRVVVKFSEPMDRFDVFGGYTAYDYGYDDWYSEQSWIEFGDPINQDPFYWPFAMADYELHEEYWNPTDWQWASKGNITGRVVWENDELHFYPGSQLKPNTRYWVKIERDARDNHAGGGSLVGAPYIFSFTTAFEPELDTDGDGLPDWYEYAHSWPRYVNEYQNDYWDKFEIVTYDEDWFDHQVEGLDPFRDDTSDSQDYDGDGVTNLEEYRDKTDLLDPASHALHWRFDKYADKVVISWNTQFSKQRHIPKKQQRWYDVDNFYLYKYRIWYCDKMGQNWKLLAGPFDATGGWLSYEDTGIVDVPSRFWAIEEYLDEKPIDPFDYINLIDGGEDYYYGESEAYFWYW